MSIFFNGQSLTFSLPVDGLAVMFLVDILTEQINSVQQRMRCESQRHSFQVCPRHPQEKCTQLFALVV